MFKTLIKISVIFCLLFSFMITFGDEAPRVNCVGLPGCVDSDITSPTSADVSNNMGKEIIGNTTGYLIQIVSVLAVFALIFSGLMYLVSSGDEEKTNKAKKWIIWSLVGVFLSISAWGIIDFINGINIDN